MSMTDEKPTLKVEMDRSQNKQRLQNIILCYKWIPCLMTM